ncbi:MULTISPECIES: hypothetical protein [unclassified Actinopolyspora]|nr:MULTISPECIES: hypothetical protein [unclassified Actinopolyspora]NHD16141.1 hypothetical protein [Actinopolyspora sp. BKK2]NHE74645.1 hypothetical protein [Actinopolyspora sp. BKK1]
MLTNQLLGVDEWTPALLEQCQRDLVGVLAEEWGARLSPSRTLLRVRFRR